MSPKTYQSNARKLLTLFFPGTLFFLAFLAVWLIPSIETELHKNFDLWFTIIVLLVSFLFLLIIVLSLRYRRNHGLTRAILILLYLTLISKGIISLSPTTAILLTELLLLDLLLFSFFSEHNIFSLKYWPVFLVLGLETAGVLLVELVPEVSGWLSIFYTNMNNLMMSGSLAFLGIDHIIIGTVAVLTLSFIFLHQSSQDRAANFWTFLIVLVQLSIFSYFTIEFQFFFNSLPLLLSLTCIFILELVALFETSYRMAYYDQLTGLPGRRAFDDAIRHLGRHYSVVMGDVDHFKKFNDTYGHDVGDQVLQMVGANLSQIKHGKAYRYGGEEFAIIFIGVREKEAQEAIEETRKQISNYRFKLRNWNRHFLSKKDRNNNNRKKLSKVESPEDKKGTIQITMSFGVAQRYSKDKPLDVIKLADEGLYKAKEKGRNQTIIMS